MNGNDRADGAAKRMWTAIILLLAIVFVLIVGNEIRTALATAGKGPEKTPASDAAASAGAQAPTTAVPKPKPDLSQVPDGPEGEAIKYGYRLMNETNTLLPDYVGNDLSCSSCHAGGGMDDTSPYLGVAAVFPQYISRSGKVLTLEDRINGCFMRSMNGKPLPYNSDEMRAMVAYLTFISEGVPIGIKERPWIVKNRVEAYRDMTAPNLDEGKKLYEQACAACHGQNGEGTGPTTGPALWGDRSFNIGAGIARIGTMAGYIKRNMPLGQMGGIKQGELTDEQAVNLAAYILSHDRPDFAPKGKDWPNGDAPDDAAYITDAEREKGFDPSSAPWYKGYAERAIEAAKSAKSGAGQKR
ncbi:MAG: Cytochrome c family protein [Hydrogenibacillus schlegelii]|uniref:Cytochrome c family protein n=1 Tax=Hydrogenibacillus schlegelii TaxID=1484 RepID=A0A2T5GEQ3_HYDSH|nr:c-type cytochrome [Hydrogenibacillus schlegelii]PTQ54664.1 MAG: Cytochrome c family protein [Hydrogenibacillus schlegelii]